MWMPSTMLWPPGNAAERRHNTPHKEPAILMDAFHGSKLLIFVMDAKRKTFKKARP
jgi:hypothetical protein